MSPSKPRFEGLSVISTLALKGVLDAAAPAQSCGYRVEFHATQALLKDIAAGKRADVVILTEEGIAELSRQGLLQAGSETPLGRSGVGLAVRAGAARPDISSVAALERALVSADSVGHSRMGASGLYFAALLERLGIAGRLRKRVIVDKGPVAAGVAAGEIALGAQLLCELAPVRGIDIVGPLPDEVQKLYAFSAAAMAGAAQPGAARAFLAFLRSDAARAEMRRCHIT
ncbi:MAG TPA: substrate-binding domain-containing protein [Burkholderiales bacterium]